MSVASRLATALGLPVKTTAPTITGLAKEGVTLGTTGSAWSGSPTTYTRRWLRAYKDGTGAITDDDGHYVGAEVGTSSTYLVQTGADLGQYLFFEELATNAAGTALEWSQSNLVGPVVAGVAANVRRVATGDYRVVSAGNYRKAA